MNRWATYAIAAACAASSLLAFSPQADAFTPKQGGDFVREVEVRPANEFADLLPGEEEKPNVVLAGRDHCESLMSDETNEVTYAFTLSGSADTLIQPGDIYFFATEHGSLPEDFQCEPGRVTNCDSVDDRGIFNTNVEPGEEDTSASVQTVTIRVRDLLQDAVEDLAHGDQLRVIESQVDCNPDGEDAFDQHYVVRLFLNDGNTERLADASIRIDTIRPPAPSAINDVTATESALYLSWEQTDRGDAERYYAFWSTEDITGMDIDELKDSGAQSDVIELDDNNPEGPTFSGRVSLGNINADDSDARIYAAVVSRDEAENYSEPTFADEGVEVLPVIDFWESYREAGGGERGGCTSAGDAVPAGAMALLMLGGGLLWRRRS